MKRQGHLFGITTLAIFVAFSWLLSNSVARAQCATGACAFVPFAPSVGQIDTPIAFNTTATQTQGSFTMTRTVSDGGDSVSYQITRGSGSDSVSFSRNRSVATATAGFSVTATFIGAHGALFRVSDRSTNTAHIELVYFNLCTTSPVETPLYERVDYPGTANPNPQFLRNGDSTSIFVPVLINDIPSVDTFELSVFRTDTGARLCNMVNQNRATSERFTAEIAAGTPRTVRIHRLASNGTDVFNPTTCNAPVANDTVTPQPLNFAAIVNTTTSRRDVTFTNTGTDTVQISGIGTSAHFAPVNFACFQLAPGQARSVTIQFSPGGTNGPFNENLSITRTPAVGPASINCTGSATSPVPVVQTFTPPCGPVGTVVVITGTGFTGATAVRFNGTPATAVTINSATQITATVPAGATTGRISVVSPGGTGVSSTDFSVGVLPVVTITATDATAIEPANTGQFTLSRTGSTTALLDVSLQIGGTATSGADYLALASPRRIGAGSPTATITVTPNDDTTDEPNQTVTVTVAPGACYTPGTPSLATVTIQDNDPPPVLTIGEKSVLEGDIQSDGVFATVTLSARSENTVSVNWATSTGVHTFIRRCFTSCTPSGVCSVCNIPCLPAQVITSTAVAGLVCASPTDFLTSSGAVTWAAGTTSLVRNISVPICGDRRIEADEFFFVGLASPTNATISNFGCGNNDTAVATIRNNDGLTGSFDLTPTEPTVAEDERLNYAFTWTVPDPLNWHDLQSLQFRIRDSEDTVLWLSFDEANGTFSSFDERRGEFEGSFVPGSQDRLHTRHATLYLADTSVAGSGPTGPSVTLNLSLSFDSWARTRTLLVEVAASDDFGHRDDFAFAGTLSVIGDHDGAHGHDSEHGHDDDHAHEREQRGHDGDDR